MYGVGDPFYFKFCIKLDRVGEKSIFDLFSPMCITATVQQTAAANS